MTDALTLEDLDRLERLAADLASGRYSEECDYQADPEVWSWILS